MPYTKLILRPGVNRQYTPTLNTAGISYANNIRFLNGLPQKLGGWQQLSTDLIVGTATGMHSWAALNGNAYLAIGSDQRLAVYFGGNVYDITPIYLTSTLSGAFSTVINTKVVTIADVAHTAHVDDWIEIDGPITVGGLTLDGFYLITSVMTGVSYTIEDPTDATSTVSGGGGTVDVNYLLPSGHASAFGLAGYGIGDYGAGDYGMSGDSQLIAPLRQWCMDNWGEFLVANYTGGTPLDPTALGGPIYVWMPPIADGNVATEIVAAPDQNTCIFVMVSAQILVACGTETSGTFDPLLVRWCDISNYDDWTPTAINQAGSFRLPTGSKIIGALAASQKGLIWTDIDLWSMVYQGLPFVFGFNKLGSNCGLIAQRAVATIGSQIVWMSQDNFYSYGANGVQSLDCTVWDVVFRDLDTAQTDKIFAWTNSLFNEVWFFFPTLSGGTGQVDAYVKIALSSGLWDYGAMPRTAGCDGSILGGPVAVDGDHLIQQHDVQGVNDDNGEPLPWFFETGFFELADGEEFVFIDRLLPDFISTTNAIVDITVYSREYPDGPTLTYGPYAYIMGGSELPRHKKPPYVPVRVRGRLAAFRIAGDDLGSFVRLGAVHWHLQPDGRR